MKFILIKEKKMKKTSVLSMLMAIIVLVGSTSVVFAEGHHRDNRQYGWGGHHEQPHYHNRGYRGYNHNRGPSFGEIVIGAAVVGATIGIVEGLTGPPPPPVVYVNPPPPQTIYQQQPVDYQSQQSADYQASQTGTSRTVIETLGYDPQKYYSCRAKKYDANGNLIESYIFTMSEPCEQYRPAH